MVTDPILEAQWSSDLLTPRLARVALQQFAASFLDDDQLAAALLLTTEVVTNAVCHACGPVTFRASIHDTSLMVEVCDDLPGDIEPSLPGPQSECGRGLRIIDALATRWGSARTPSGKRVWFEIPCHLS
jgi:hypothetical protein